MADTAVLTQADVATPSILPAADPRRKRLMLIALKDRIVRGQKQLPDDNGLRQHLAEMLASIDKVRGALAAVDSQRRSIDRPRRSSRTRQSSTSRSRTQRRSTSSAPPASDSDPPGHLSLALQRMQTEPIPVYGLTAVLAPRIGGEA